jgi:methylmalonyl-CoA/ethylmalonyl-CoA epimerase
MKLHHVGVVVKDIQVSIDEYVRRYGAVVASPVMDDPLQQATVVLLTVDSSTFIELVAPFGDDSPLHRAVDRKAPLHHLCFEVPNVIESIAALRADGMVTVSEPKPAVLFDGRVVAWMWDRTNSLVELLEA